MMRELKLLNVDIAEMSFKKKKKKKNFRTNIDKKVSLESHVRRLKMRHK